MMNLISYKLDCEIIHIFGKGSAITYLSDTVLPIYYPDKTGGYFPIYTNTGAGIFSGDDYVASIVFDSTQLDCQLEINEAFGADNICTLTVWNLPDAALVRQNDILKVSFYWDGGNFLAQKYYAEMVIETITKTTESEGTKLILIGTALIDYIFKSTSVIHTTGLVDIRKLMGIIQERFGLYSTLNLKHYDIYLLTRGKSITDLLEEFCKEYSEKYKVSCTWYVFGSILVLQDGSIPSEDTKFLTPIIDYTDIIKLELMEEVLTEEEEFDEESEGSEEDFDEEDIVETKMPVYSLTKKSIKLEISGLPSLKKESFITIDYSNVPKALELALPIINESFIVTEVQHNLGSESGFYSTVYCYRIRDEVTNG